MATKFLPRPLSLPFITTFPVRFFHKPLSLCLFSTTTTTTTSCTTTLFSSLDHYGPSLKKGHKPSHFNPSFSPKLPNYPSPLHTDTNIISDNNNDQNVCESLFDESIFTRVYNIAAIRVPSEQCFALESRLRGHLLNWPRIRNIARVPGDDVDDEVKDLLENSNKETLATLNTRINGEESEDDEELLSPVLYRDKLAKTFNSRGYVKFKNLAKLSRPKKRKKVGKEEGKRGNVRRGVGKNEIALVEVVEDQESEEEDMSGLLGEEFKGRKWRGSTRLLLLDEGYADKGVDDMPEAIKAVLKEHEDQHKVSTFELVNCKLTLFYNYWQMNEILEALLPEGTIVPSAFETVGHIAHLNLKEEHLPYRNIIAKVVLDKNKPKIQTVVNKIDAIHNDYRTMQLEVLAGNHSLVTTVVENGLRFHVDLATVYWNSRLATERQRLISCFSSKDVVCDVFAGVGPIAISAAKKVKYVYANDLNPYAVEYLERNSVLNKLERKIETFNMDGRRFIDTIFASQKSKPITQVVMNLPKDAAEFLDIFRGIFRRNHIDKDNILPRIHVYGFSKAQDPEFDFHERIRIALSEVAFEVEMRKVRLVAPGKWMLCASFTLPERVAYAKTVDFDS